MAAHLSHRIRSARYSSEHTEQSYDQAMFGRNLFDYHIQGYDGKNIGLVERLWVITSIYNLIGAITLLQSHVEQAIVLTVCGTDGTPVCGALS